MQGKIAGKFCEIMSYRSFAPLSHGRVGGLFRLGGRGSERSGFLCHPRVTPRSVAADSPLGGLTPMD